jgi:hypothetical protein
LQVPWPLPEICRNGAQPFAKHGFERPFQLDEDFARQDKLTIWIEFLYHEYWLGDKLVAALITRQSLRDEPWNELVDSGLLKPHETVESINYDQDDWCEYKAAKKDFDAAELSVKQAQSGAGLVPQSAAVDENAQSACQAQIAQLEATTKRYDLIHRRMKLISNFF